MSHPPPPSRLEPAAEQSRNLPGNAGNNNNEPGMKKFAGQTAFEPGPGMLCAQKIQSSEATGLLPMHNLVESVERSLASGCK